MMTIAIHQPNYIPYLGFFYKVFKSDTFVFLDDVQYSKNNWHNRNRIKTPQGELFLTIPVQVKLGQKINEVYVDFNGKWKEKHLKSIEMNYKKAPYFKEVFKDLTDLFEYKGYANIADFNISLIQMIAKKMGMKTRFKFVYTSGTSQHRLANICKQLQADVYLSGIDGKKYIDEEVFGDTKVIYSDYESLVYPQQWGEFLPNLSIIDYLMNCGYTIPKEWIE